MTFSRKKNEILPAIAVALFLVFLSSNARALSFDKNLKITTGMLSINTLKNTSKNDASTSTLGTNYVLPIRFDYKFNLLGLNWMTGLLYTPIPVEAPDNGSKSTVLYPAFLSDFQLNDSLNLQLGLGYFRRTISGTGGEIVQNNGLSTSTFSLPGRKVTTSNFTLEVALDWSKDNYVLGLSGIITSPLTSRRSLNALFALGYRL